METHFGTLEQAQNKLEQLLKKDYSNDNNADTDFWSRLNDYTSKFSQSQLEFVVKSKEVQQADKEMKDMFMLFLFEKFKGSFASIEAFRPVCNKYIDTVIKVSGDFEAYSKNIEEENAELGKENEQLKNRLVELERQVKNAAESGNSRPNSKRA